MRGKIRNNGSNRRDHRSRRQERSGNYKFVRRDGSSSYRERRRNFNNRRKQFNRPFRRKEKLTQEKLNDDLDNYFERKGGEGFKDHLDNELEIYKNNAKMNENLKKESISLPQQQTEEKKVEEQNVEMKVENEEKPKEETKEEVEGKKDDKKKKKKGKK